jgi:hypothetical protein
MVSYLNAVAVPVPTGLPLAVAAPMVSYLNAVPALVPASTPLWVDSAVVSFLNASAVESEGTWWQVSPVVSYRNE